MAEDPRFPVKIDNVCEADILSVGKLKSGQTEGLGHENKRDSCKFPMTSDSLPSQTLRILILLGDARSLCFQIS